jgi:hypothetical protein
MLLILVCETEEMCSFTPFFDHEPHTNLSRTLNLLQEKATGLTFHFEIWCHIVKNIHKIGSISQALIVDPCFHTNRDIWTAKSVSPAPVSYDIAIFLRGGQRKDFLWREPISSMHRPPQVWPASRIDRVQFFTHQELLVRNAWVLQGFSASVPDIWHIDRHRDNLADDVVATNNNADGSLADHYLNWRHYSKLW